MALFFHEVRERERDGIVILELKGRLGLGSEETALQQRLEVLLESDKKNVIVDLRHISSIDAAVTESVIRYDEQFKNAGGRLVLLNPARENVSASELLELDTVVPAYTDEQDAVNSFYPDRKVPHYDVLEFVEEELHHADSNPQEKRG